MALSSSVCKLLARVDQKDTDCVISHVAMRFDCLHLVSLIMISPSLTRGGSREHWHVEALRRNVNSNDPECRSERVDLIGSLMGHAVLAGSVRRSSPLRTCAAMRPTLLLR